MDFSFSELFQQTSFLCEFSPNGKFIANCCQCRLVIREASSLQVINLHTCLDPLQYIEWSPDSLYVLCGMYSRGIVQVWSLEQPEWTCKIDEGLSGLVSANWTPDSRHILTTCDFHLRITVWSLTRKTVSYMKWPKLDKGSFATTPDGNYLCLAERREGKDFVSVFALESWEMLAHFPVKTEDLSIIKSSPDCTHFCVIDNCIFCKVCVYSLDGRCLTEYNPYSNSLGIKSCQWSPAGQLLAIGAYDQKIRLLNHLTWSVIVDFEHTQTIDSKYVDIFVEVESKPDFGKDFGVYLAKFQPNHSSSSKYETKKVPYSVPVRKPNSKEPDPKIGISQLSFSSNSAYLVSKNDNMPNTLWIWDVKKTRLGAVLTQLNEVKNFGWDPLQTRLALCTGSNKIYIWSAEIDGCSSVDLPSEISFSVRSLKWNPNGKSIALCSNTHFCICFMDELSNE